jgi:transposase
MGSSGGLTKFFWLSDGAAKTKDGANPGDHTSPSGENWATNLPRSQSSPSPDITLRALATELSERGIKVSYFAVWHFFEHEGISFKKSLHASEQDRPDGQTAGAVEKVSRAA